MSTYIIKQKYFAMSDKFTIYNGDGNEAYICESKMTAFPKRFWLSNTDGTPLFFTRRKLAMLFPKVEIYAGDGEEGAPIAIVKGQFSIFRARLKMEGAEFGKYIIRGTTFGRRFSIKKKDGKRKVLLAKIYKRFKISDEYVLDVYEGNDSFMVTLCIILDSIYHPGH